MKRDAAMGDAVKKSRLFSGIGEDQIARLAECLGGREVRFEKGGFLYHEGDFPVMAGLVLEGSVHIIKEDFWGNRTILGHVETGDLFGETYNCLGDEPLRVSVEAAEDGACLFLDLQRVLKGRDGAAFGTDGSWEKDGLLGRQNGPLEQDWQRLTSNLMEILAGKNLFLTEKMEYLTQRTTREKLLHYLSAQSRRAGSEEFEIPFDRQQLADFLAVDRSAMSSVLGKLRDEKVLEFHKNRFRLNR